MPLNHHKLAILAAALAMVEIPPDPEVKLLTENGWIPLGQNCSTGLNGWGKVINREAVTVDQPEAVKIQSGQL